MLQSAESTAKKFRPGLINLCWKWAADYYSAWLTPRLKKFGLLPEDILIQKKAYFEASFLMPYEAKRAQQKRIYRAIDCWNKHIYLTPEAQARHNPWVPTPMWSMVQYRKERYREKQEQGGHLGAGAGPKPNPEPQTKLNPFG